MPVNVVFIGDPLLDVAAESDPATVAAYGLRNDDWVQADETHDELFRKLLVDPRSKFIAGGSAQNSARVAKWILKDLGNVTFTGCVGRDAFSEKMAQVLLHDGVKPMYFEVDSMPTGICACLTGANGMRALCSNLGAATAFSLYHMHSDALRIEVEKADAIFITSYFIRHSPHVVDFVCRFCFWTHKHLAISLSAAFICRNYARELAHSLRYADLVFGTAKEAITFVCAATRRKAVHLEECVKWIADLPRENVLSRRIVVISDGPHPVTTCASGERPKFYPVPPVPAIVDTVGCGDALAAGFLSMFLLTNSVDDSMAAGMRAARMITQMKGCQLPRVL